MQTFLPYPNFTQSARCLDMRRLGKQRVECKQIFTALTDPSYGWQNHPATQMWRGHEGSLLIYMTRICEEWRHRGYRDTLLAFARTQEVPIETFDPPSWLGDPAFHASHRSNLLRKDPEHYGQFGWTEPHNLEYVWPTPRPSAATPINAGELS